MPRPESDAGLAELTEIAAWDDDVADIVARRLDRNGKGRFRGGTRRLVTGAVTQAVEPQGQIVESLGDDMDNALFALQFSGAAQQGGAQRGAPETLEDRRPDNQIGDPGLVLDRDKDDAVGTAGTLADQDDPGDRQPSFDRQMDEVGGGDQPLAGELGAQKRQRMALQAQAGGGVILDDMLAQRNRRQ